VRVAILPSSKERIIILRKVCWSLLPAFIYAAAPAARVDAATVLTVFDNYPYKCCALVRDDQPEVEA
jgi:hypothetical protein